MGLLDIAYRDVANAPQGKRKGSARYGSRPLTFWDMVEAADLSTIPVLSDAAAGLLAAKEAAAGNYGAAALNAAGVLPFVPAMAGIFAGKGAKTADALLLAKAQEMTKAGENPFKVWQETGWTDQFPDGKWRFEIDDSAASMKNVPQPRPLGMGYFAPPLPVRGKLSDFTDHPELMNAYPSLGKIRTHIDVRGGTGAKFDDKKPYRFIIDTKEDKAKNFLLHEIQHAIQTKEKNFAKGANAPIGEMFQWMASGKHWSEFPGLSEYMKSAGEAEARLVQKRMDYTPEMRRAIAPWEEFDVPIDQQIVRFGDGPAMAIEPLWHGSPHKFDKFDLSKIGTGEGSQAYGHGAYLAQAKETGETYQGMLAPLPRLFDKKGNIREPKSYAESIAESRASGVGSVKEAITRTQRILDSGPESYDGLGREFVEEGNILAALRRFEMEGLEVKPGGYLYESRLRWPDAAREAADPLGPQHFLDFDTPVREQKSILDAIDKKYDPEVFLEQMGVVDRKATGGDLLRSLGGTRDPQRAQDVANMLRDKFGIPGIRYLDAVSRGTGQGTHNYVVFDDSLIEILKRNGVPVEGLLEKAAR